MATAAVHSIAHRHSTHAYEPALHGLALLHALFGLEYMTTSPLSVDEDRKISARGFLTVLLMPLIVFVTISYEMLPVGLLSPIAEGLGVSPGEAGLFVSAYSIVVVLGAIPFCAALAKFPAKHVLLGTVLVFFLSSAVFVTAPNYAVALIARLVGGAAHGVIFTTTLRIAVAAVPVSRRGFAVAAGSAGNALALSFGVPAGAAIADLLDWRAPFCLVAVGFLLLGLTSQVLVPAQRDPRRPILTTRQALGTLRNKSALFMTVIMLTVSLAHFMSFTYFEPRLREAGLNGSAVSTALMIYGIASAAGLILGARYVDRHAGRVLLISVCGLLMVMVLSAVLIGPTVTVVLLAIWGFVFGPLPVSFQILTLRATEDATEVAPSLVNTSFNIGIFGGSTLGAAVLGPLGPHAIPLLSAIVIAAPLTLWIVTARNRSMRFTYGPSATPESAQV